jgi:hypothetical protein
MTTRQDRERALRVADQLARCPLSWAERRQVERAAVAAEILARQLQQRATRRRGR